MFSTSQSQTFSGGLELVPVLLNQSRRDDHMETLADSLRPGLASPPFLWLLFHLDSRVAEALRSSKHLLPQNTWLNGPPMKIDSLVRSSGISQFDDHQLLLVVRSRLDDFHEAAQILTERLGGFVVAIISSVGRLQADDLADVTQQVWIRTFASEEETFETAAEFRAWLKSVARTKTIDFLRRRTLASIPENVDPCVTTHQESPQVVALELCMKELETAKPDFARVVRGICGGKSGQQLSAELGISQNTVYSRFDRSKMLLQECIERRLA